MSATLDTARLRLREPAASDADFIFALLNDPDWIRYIGDRNVRDAAGAWRYIDERLLSSFRAHGFGLWVVEQRDDGRAIGLCGLLRRDTHPDVEIGFAFLPQARGQGFAAEAAVRTLEHAEHALQLTRVIGITLPGNATSTKLLRRLGLHFEDAIVFHSDGELVHRYAIALPRRPSSGATIAP